MRIRPGLLAALLCVSLPAAAADPAPAAPRFTAETLVQKHLEARGGLAALKAIKSLRTQGTLRAGGDGWSMEMAYVDLTRRDGMYRGEATVQGLTSIEAFDGRDAWQVQPFGGRKDPEKLSADDSKGLRRQADIDGVLVDWKQKGHTVEYLGTEDVDGTEAHKLRVRLKDGDTQYVYLDPDHFLEIRVVTQSRVRGAQRETETDYGNYEKVAGVYFPFSVESGRKGGPKTQKVTVQKVEANVEMDAALFHYPDGKPPAPVAVPSNR